MNASRHCFSTCCQWFLQSPSRGRSLRLNHYLELWIAYSSLLRAISPKTFDVLDIFNGRKSGVHLGVNGSGPLVFLPKAFFRQSLCMHYACMTYVLLYNYIHSSSIHNVYMCICICVCVCLCVSACVLERVYACVY